MYSEIYFIADFFYEDLTGGAELNDYSLLKYFSKNDIAVKKVHCKNVTIEFLENNRKKPFIISNFVTLNETNKQYIRHNLNYVIYEHDHKYLRTRNPIFYKNFKAPPNDIINRDFYEKAKAVVCLTNLAVDTIEKNTGLKNIKKMGSSVWTSEDLDYIEVLLKTSKNNKYAIMDSNNPIKRTSDCIKYCKNNNLSFELISSPDHRKFLKKLSSYHGLIFMTGHLETCGRIVVEAKMLNCKVITQEKLIGAASESWFKKDGKKLIEEMRKISNNSINIFIEALNIY